MKCVGVVAQDRAAFHVIAPSFCNPSTTYASRKDQDM
jgi:hypothetical protein